MTWYKSEANIYMIYLTPNGIGVYLELDPSTDKIAQLFITDKLFSLKRVENTQGYSKPDKATTDKIWKQIVEHPSWDKMLIEQIFTPK